MSAPAPIWVTGTGTSCNLSDRFRAVTRPSSKSVARPILGVVFAPRSGPWVFADEAAGPPSIDSLAISAGLGCAYAVSDLVGRAPLERIDTVRSLINL